MEEYNPVDLKGATALVSSPLADGRWINERVSRIVEIIQDYDSTIEVQWIPEDQRLRTDPAFRLIEHRPDGRKFIMFYVNNELEFDERVLARVIDSDQARNPLSLAAMDKKNTALKLIAAKEKMDELEDKHDLAAHIWKSGRARYRHDGVVYE